MAARALLAALVLLLQVAVLPGLGVPYRPDLLRLFAALTGVLGGERAGLLAGLGVGLLADALAGRLLGLRTLLTAAAGWCAGRAGRYVVREQPLVVLAAVVCIAAAEDVVTFAFLRSLEVHVPLVRAASGVLLPGIVADLVAAVPLYAAMRRWAAPSSVLGGTIYALAPQPPRVRMRVYRR